MFSTSWLSYLLLMDIECAGWSDALLCGADVFTTALECDVYTFSRTCTFKKLKFINEILTSKEQIYKLYNVNFFTITTLIHPKVLSSNFKQ